VHAGKKIEQRDLVSKKRKEKMVLKIKAQLIIFIIYIRFLLGK